MAIYINIFWGIRDILSNNSFGADSLKSIIFTVFREFSNYILMKLFKNYDIIFFFWFSQFKYLNI